MRLSSRSCLWMLLAVDVSLPSWRIKTSECGSEGCSEARQSRCLPSFTSQRSEHLLISRAVSGCWGINFYFLQSIQPEQLLLSHVTLHPGCTVINAFALFLHWGETLRGTSPRLHKEIILFTQSELMTLSGPLMILLALSASNRLVITSKQ